MRVIITAIILLTSTAFADSGYSFLGRSSNQEKTIFILDNVSRSQVYVTIENRPGLSFIDTITEKDQLALDKLRNRDWGQEITLILKLKEGIQVKLHGASCGRHLCDWAEVTYHDDTIEVYYQSVH